MSAPEDKAPDKWVWFEDEPDPIGSSEPAAADAAPRAEGWLDELLSEPKPGAQTAKPGNGSMPTVPAIEDSILILQSKLSERLDAALRRVDETPRPFPVSRIAKPEPLKAEPPKPLVPAATPNSPLADAAALHREGRTAEAVERLLAAMKASGETPVELLTALGGLRHAIGQHAEAAENFRAVVAKNAAHPGAHFRLAVCLLQLGQLDDAAAAFRQAVALSESDWEARLGAGLCDLRRGRGTDALLWFQQCNAAKPNDPAGMFGRAAALEMAGRLDEAIPAYMGLIERAPESIEARDRLMTIHLGRGEWPQAAVQAQAIVEKDAANLRGLTALAACEIRQGRIEVAAGYAARLTKAAPASFEAWVTLARCHQAAGRAAEAAAALKEAARVQPDSADVQVSLAVIRRNQGDLPGARRALEAALKIDPVHMTAIERLAELTEKSGDLAEAEKLWTRLAGAGGPQASGATLHCGVVRLQMGDAPGAASAFSTFLEHEPDSIETRVNLGIAQWRAGQAGDALKTLEDVIGSHPGLADAWYAYAYAAIDLEDYAAARRGFEALSGLGDRSAEVSYNLGLILQQAGEMDAARGHYLRALEERATLREAMERLGQVEQSLGNTDEAKAWWTKLRDAGGTVKPPDAKPAGKK